MINQLRRSRMIYSHETALYLHDLRDRDPVRYVVTVPHGYNQTRLKNEGLVVHTVEKELFELAVCTKKTNFGNKLKKYDMDTTIWGFELSEEELTEVLNDILALPIDDGVSMTFTKL